MRLRYDRLNKKIPHAAGYSSLFMALLVAVQIVFDFINLVHKNTEYMKTLPREEAEDFNKLTGYNLGMFFTHLLMLFVVLTFHCHKHLQRRGIFTRKLRSAFHLCCLEDCGDIQDGFPEHSSQHIFGTCISDAFLYDRCSVLPLHGKVL